MKDNAIPLKAKVPYDQLRPYVVSELHKEENSSRGSDSADTNIIYIQDNRSDDSIKISDNKLHKSNICLH